MNYNIVSYAIYIALSAYIILRVGYLFYHFGEIYLRYLLAGNAALAKSLSNLLLMGYYLLNLGFAFYNLGRWPRILNLNELLYNLCQNVGGICLILGLLHFGNLFWIYLLQKRNSIL